MKTAKSYKLISILTVFVLCVLAAFFSMTMPVNADEAVKITPKATDYFTGVTDSTLVFEDDAAVASVKSNSTVLIKNRLCVEDFAIKFVLADGIDSFTLNLTYDSFYVNGNKKADGSFKKSIENKVIIKDGSAHMEGAESAKKSITTTNGEIEIKLTVSENNYLLATVNGKALEAQKDAFYKIRKVDKALAKISYTATFDGEGEKEVKLFSVDQKAGDITGAYKQTFVLDDGKLTPASPVIGFSEDAFTKTLDGYKLCFRDDETETIAPKAYSFLGNVSKVYIHSNDTDNVKVIGDDKVRFAAGQRTFFIGDKKDANSTNVLATYTVNVQNSDVVDTSAPVYVKDALALESFKAALADAYTDGDHFVAVGEQITLPSFADLVYDNLTPYSELKVTVYYKSTTTDTSSSSNNITLNAAGDYVFYAVFADTDGNSMNKEDFIKEEHDQVPEYVEAMRDFVFNFTIEDDAPLVVKEANQGKGYVGTKYTASKFTVDAEGCTVVYKLYYNTANGWVEIPKLASVTNENYNQNGYTYEDIKSIGYDGTLTFTPNKTGEYKIECTATSKHVVGKTKTASATIRVEEKAMEIEPESWIENNVWTVVFLGVGSLCLIAIIVLLFIKPKEKNDEE